MIRMCIRTAEFQMAREDELLGFIALLLDDLKLFKVVLPLFLLLTDLTIFLFYIMDD